MYRTVHEFGTDEFIEKKSRFIGYVFFVTSEEEAQQKVAQMKEQHRDATHNCWAYIIGEEGLIQRYSDDGEPSGTAGVPILEVLKKENLRNVAAVVTRYFGGTLLGAGGLVRAYSKGVKIALDAAGCVVMEEFLLCRYTYDYTNHGKIINHLTQSGYVICTEEYTDKVSIELHVRENASLTQELMDFTGGNLTVEEVKKEILPTIEGKIVYGGNHG